MRRFELLIREEYCLNPDFVIDFINLEHDAVLLEDEMAA
jgi:hypothetical protein